VRVVRAEEDVVGALESDEAIEVVLPERVVPDVSQEDVAGCSGISSMMLGTLAPVVGSSWSMRNAG
jgi:hypothetical protein